MRFSLLDRITKLEPGARIEAIKNVSLAEEYLSDHFPQFPVLPGVLMLEAMTQAGAWLVRASDDFAHSVVILKEARNVKYAGFVEPGRTLQVSADITQLGDREVKLKAQGTIDGESAVAARLVLQRYNLADEPGGGEGKQVIDSLVKQQMRSLFALLYNDKPKMVAG